MFNPPKTKWSTFSIFPLCGVSLEQLTFPPYLWYGVVSLPLFVPKTNLVLHNCEGQMRSNFFNCSNLLLELPSQLYQLEKPQSDHELGVTWALKSKEPWLYFLLWAKVAILEFKVATIATDKRDPHALWCSTTTQWGENILRYPNPYEEDWKGDCIKQWPRPWGSIATCCIYVIG